MAVELEPRDRPHPGGAEEAGPSRPIDARGGRRVRVYSRLIAAMKVLLPLAVAAAIAVIYLGAQRPGDLTEIFSPEELATLGAGLRLENPRYSGVTARGEPFAIRADWALPDSAMPRFIDLERPNGEVKLKDGRTVAARSPTGRLHREEEILVLTGGVVLDTSDGYHMETDVMELDLGAKTAHAPGPVTGTGPSGRIDAGSFRAISGNRDGGSDDAAGKIWFENRVRLVFIPEGTPGSASDSNLNTGSGGAEGEIRQ